MDLLVSEVGGVVTDQIPSLSTSLEPSHGSMNTFGGCHLSLTD